MFSSNASPWKRGLAAPVVLGEVVERADLAGEEATAERREGTRPIPSSRSVGRPASGLRVQSEYSLWTAVIGWMAWARRIVSGTPRTGR